MSAQVHHPLVELARRAIEAYIRRGEEIPVPASLPADLPARAGAFVSLHARGELRGCIGTIEPSQPSLAAEVIHNAIMAATQDPRFPPVTEDELSDLDISVDVLGTPEAITSLKDLDPRRYGVIVKRGFRRGLLLPDLEGVDTPECQVDIARRKAGIGAGEPVDLMRFEVRRFH